MNRTAQGHNYYTQSGYHTRSGRTGGRRLGAHLKTRDYHLTYKRDNQFV